MSIIKRLLEFILWLAVALYVLVLGSQSGNGSTIMVGLALAFWSIWVLVRSRKKLKDQPETLAERLAKK